jgi:hypothetical protein
MATPTTTSLTSSANPSTYGQLVTFTATVSPAPPDGEPVTFFFGGDGPSQTGTLTGGVATVSISTLTVGMHDVLAVYDGDVNFDGSVSPVLHQVVNQASTTTTVTSSLNPSTFGQSVTFTATVSPAPPDGESVTFTADGNPIGTGTLTGGVASVTTSSLTAGSHAIVASYPGDTNLAGSSGSLTQVVNKEPTTTSLTSSLNPSTYGQPVTFTATVSPAPPDGELVTFFISADGPSVTAPLSGGVASITTSSLTAGSHTVLALYGGDTNLAGSSSPLLTQVVNKEPTTTTVTSSANPSTFGQPVTFTATVSPAPPNGETVTFTADGNPLGTGTLSGGVATVTTSSLTAGTHSIVATYAGDTNLAASQGSLTQVVSKKPTTTTVTSSLNPSTFGQSVTFTATVSPAPPNGETVTFTADGNPLGTGTLSGGVATVTTSSLTVGSHTIVASYPGDTNLAASQASLTQTVQAQSGTNTSLTATPAVIKLNLNTGQFFIPTLSATLTNSNTSAPIAGQTITFTATPATGTVTLGTAVTNASGTATLTNVPVSATLITADHYTATFAGASGLNPSTANASLTFQPL